MTQVAARHEGSGAKELKLRARCLRLRGQRQILGLPESSVTHGAKGSLPRVCRGCSAQPPLFLQSRLKNGFAVPDAEVSQHAGFQNPLGFTAFPLLLCTNVVRSGKGPNESLPLFGICGAGRFTSRFGTGIPTETGSPQTTDALGIRRTVTLTSAPIQGTVWRRSGEPSPEPSPKETASPLPAFCCTVI